MKTSLTALASLATLTLAVATASAESYDATQPLPSSRDYVGVNASVGAQRDLQAGLHIDGGRRIDDSPLFVRAQLGTARSGHGELYQARVGVELRGCVLAELACAFAGADVGYQRDLSVIEPWTLVPTSSDLGPTKYIDSHDALVAPRAGIELGRNLKVRVSVETPFYRTIVADTMDTDAGGMGIVVAGGLAYAF